MKKETIMSRLENAINKVTRNEKTLLSIKKQIAKKESILIQYDIDPATYDEHTKRQFCRREIKENSDLYWLCCDYDGLLIRFTKKQSQIVEAETDVEKYEAMLAEKMVDEAKAERIKGMEIIDEFLEKWKTNARTYYLNQFQKYSTFTKDNVELTMETMSELVNNKGEQKLSEAMKREYLLDKNRSKSSIKSRIAHARKKKFMRFLTNSEIFILENMHSEGYLENLLTTAVEDKKQALLSRISKKCGDILDAGGLYIANDGNINGTVRGTKETVTVTTIYAGGYNVQCLHYRVLVK